MSERSAAASSKRADAAALANTTPTASAASASAQSSHSHAASTHHIGAAASAGKRTAGAAKQSAASPSSQLSGRKRTSAAAAAAAAAADGSSSAVAASASAAHSSNRDLSASSGSHPKRQRGESSKSSSSSAAAAASSVGFDPLPASPRRPASSAAASSAAAPPSSSHNESGEDWKSDSDEDDDREGGQESKPAAAAAASKPRPRKSRVPKPHRIFTEAKGLLLGALPFAEAKISHDPSVAGMEALARSRAAVQQRVSATTMADLGRHSLLLSHKFYPALPSEQAVVRDWLLQVDQLWTQLAAAVPRMKLSWDECHALFAEAVYTGALQAVPPLARRLGHVSLRFIIDEDPLLTFWCNKPGEHLIPMQPYFRLFEFGLDPTEVEEGNTPLSAVQLARNFIREHVPPSAPSVSGPFVSMRTAVEKAESLSLPSMLLAGAFQQREATWSAEIRRRAALHTQFMQALIPAWLAHSTKARALLLEAAPDRLIPPLVDIVSRYLDLEGVPPDRSVPAGEN